MKKTEKRQLRVMLLVLLLSITTVFPASYTFAASQSTKNRRAHALYDKKVTAARKISTSVRYKYFDITGDGVHEALIDYHPKSGGSGHYFCIYTYKNGKVKQLLKEGQYGLDKLTVYKKTGTVIGYGAGHGNEWFRVYKLKNGKYRMIAGKGRRGPAPAVGSVKNGAWNYWKSGYQSISKSKYSSIVSKLKKGKARKYELTKWNLLV